MGYTNYWEKPECEITDDMRARYVEATEQISDFLGHANEDALGWSIFMDGEGETFALPHTIDEIGRCNFCKTNRHPYDAQVIASLFILTDIVPEIKVQCDGQNKDNTLEDLVFEGYELYENYIEYPKSISELFGFKVMNDPKTMPTYEISEGITTLTVVRTINGIEETIWQGNKEDIIELILENS